eukprot:7631511-Pyramimonas_sp.AAC.1
MSSARWVTDWLARRGWSSNLPTPTSGLPACVASVRADVSSSARDRPRAKPAARASSAGAGNGAPS